MLALLSGPAVNYDAVFLGDSNGSGIVYCNRYVAANLAGFDVRLHLHASPSLRESDGSNAGSRTAAFQERECPGGVACAHQRCAASLKAHDLCQRLRKNLTAIVAKS